MAKDLVHPEEWWVNELCKAAFQGMDLAPVLGMGLALASLLRYLSQAYLPGNVWYKGNGRMVRAVLRAHTGSAAETTQLLPASHDGYPRPSYSTRHTAGMNAQRVANTLKAR
jgi:hypothetical protein